MTDIGKAPWENREPAKGGRYDTAGNLLKPRDIAEFWRLNDAEKAEAERQGWVSWVDITPRRPAAIEDYPDLDLP